MIPLSIYLIGVCIRYTRSKESVGNGGGKRPESICRCDARRPSAAVPVARLLRTRLRRSDYMRTPMTKTVISTATYNRQKKRVSVTAAGGRREEAGINLSILVGQSASVGGTTHATPGPGTQVLRTRVRRSNSGAHITKRREWIVDSSLAAALR